MLDRKQVIEILLAYKRLVKLSRHIKDHALNSGDEIEYWCHQAQEEAYLRCIKIIATLIRLERKEND